MNIIWILGVVVFIISLVLWLIAIIKKDMNNMLKWVIVLNVANLTIQISNFFI